eukprot:6192061-Pleurochrysis_carterae.AAC.3
MPRTAPSCSRYGATRPQPRGPRGGPAGATMEACKVRAGALTSLGVSELYEGTMIKAKPLRTAHGFCRFKFDQISSAALRLISQTAGRHQRA